MNPDYRPDGYVIKKIADNPGIRKYGFTFDTWALLNLLREIQPDVIYQRSLKPYTGVVAYYAATTGCRAIFHIAHDYNVTPRPLEQRSGPYPLRWIDNRMELYGLRRVTSIVAQTHHQVDLLLNNYGRKAIGGGTEFSPSS